jgi:hypothetical protein
VSKFFRALCRKGSGWLSPDWSAIPAPVPYANLTNPQTLNLYAMVHDNPETFADLDGHECCDWDSVEDFAIGTLNAMSNDFAGTQRIQGNSDTTSGQKLGDAISVVAGTVGTIAAAVTDVAADVGSGGLALVAAPAQAIAIAVPANGAIQGAQNLFKSSVENSSTSGTATDSKPHGNTAGNQPAELYEKYDANGNLEKHGVSQDASKRYSKKEVGNGRVKVVDQGPRNEMLAKERQKVETNAGPKNKEPWANKRKPTH